MVPLLKMYSASAASLSFMRVSLTRVMPLTLTAGAVSVSETMAVAAMIDAVSADVGCGVCCGGGVDAGTDGCVLATITGSFCAGTPAEGLVVFAGSLLSGADAAVSVGVSAGVVVVTAAGCKLGCDVALLVDGTVRSTRMVICTDALVAVGATIG